MEEETAHILHVFILLSVLNGGIVRQTLSLWIEIRVHPELEIRG